MKKPHKYSVYRQNSRIKIKKITTKLQQTKEPDITTYTKKYRVMEERCLKKSIFFYVVKQQTISFLLDYPKLIGIWFVKGLLCEQYYSTLYKAWTDKYFFKSRKEMTLD